MQPPIEYELEFHATIRQSGNYNSGLEVRETVKIHADTFLEVASILAKFHDLSMALKAK
jgi:hypothetical protein